MAPWSMRIFGNAWFFGPCSSGSTHESMHLLTFFYKWLRTYGFLFFFFSNTHFHMGKLLF